MEPGLTLTQVSIQFAFGAAALFGIVYGAVFRFRWWETPTGRAVITLSVSVVFALLPSVLIIWGVPITIFEATPAHRVPVDATILSWLSVAGIDGAGVSLLVLAWVSVQQRRQGKQRRP